jgi:signal transduction histidine kinase
LPRSDTSLARPSSRLGFGLRPRLLGALALTSVVTLAVAAAALLPPLKSRLRDDALRQTVSALEAAKPGLGGIKLVRGLPLRSPLEQQAIDLKQRSGLERVIVWTSGLVHPYKDTDPHEPLDVARTLARTAFAQRSSKLHPVDQVSGNLLLVASTYETHHHLFVLELFTKLNYVDTATDVVSGAFLEAAAAGLLVALLLGAALSSRLVRRLRMLRDATSGLDDRGLHDLALTDDEVRDEIGELAREFAQMRARLRAQEDARRAFISTASHELRTPLTSLDGMLELLADDLENDPIDIEDARERVARAQQQSRRLSSLASDLLDLSRMDAELELRSEPVELGELARAVIAEFELRALERDLTLSVDGADSHHWTEGDPTGLARIVRILLDNALRIAPPHSTVSVRVDTNSEQASLEVSDDGPGVPADERELIFERFQRGRDHRGEAGFGLGLAIGRELAQRMGGRLDLVSDPPGATFRMELVAVAVGAHVE